MRHVLILLLLMFSANTTVTDADGFRGPAFTDPSGTVTDMPPAWINQPIQIEPEFSQAELAITLDQQIYAQLLPLIQDYAARHQTQIAVSNGTCGISAGLLRRKAVDVGGFCCPPSLADRLPGLRFHTLGISAIALITHPSNTVDNLSYVQAQRIFQGEILDWAQVDRVVTQGKKSPIHVIGRLHCKLRPGHWRLLLDNEDLFTTDLIDVGTIQDILGAVTNDRYAIGYETLWMIEHGGGTQRTKILSINGIKPDDRLALARGRYPLYRVYSITSWEGSAGKPLARELVLYLQEQMTQLDKKYHIVSASELRHYGWRFNAEELVGEPEQK